MHSISPLPQCLLLKVTGPILKILCPHPPELRFTLPAPKALTPPLLPLTEHSCHSVTWQDGTGVQPLPSQPFQSPAPPCTHHPLVPGSEPAGASSSPISWGSGEAMAVVSPTFITGGGPCSRKKLGWLKTQEKGRRRRKGAGRGNRLSRGSLFLTQAVWDRKTEN